jgi:hypothetical protein
LICRGDTAGGFDAASYFAAASSSSWLLVADIDQRTIAKALYDRRSSASVIRRDLRDMKSGSAQAAYCHDNVARFVGEHPDHRGVYGWIVRDNSDIGYVWFFPHSVVADPSGKMFDITPLRGPSSAFPAHEGTDEEFEALVLRLGTSALIYQIGT